MSLSLRWVGREQAEIVGRVRALCYSPLAKNIPDYQKYLAADERVPADDLLLAERDGAALGTATAYPMTMWVRGGPVACQGVAFVGTIKTHRRSARTSADDPGIATALMRETLRRARDRGQVVSALMPFRATFYEHFGYGLVERRNLWTIPLSVLPHGPADGFAFIEGDADEPRRACRQRMVEAGQCDIERPAGSWLHHTKQEDDGWTVADQPGGPGSPMNSWAHFDQEKVNGKDHLKVYDLACDSPAALRRLLCFFATLRDQYWAVQFALPADLPINLWLREPQLPHRLVNHDTAGLQPQTRMQIRVLDHAAFLGAMRTLPANVRGAATVAVAETEGHVSRLRFEVADGQAMATPTTAEADVECTDRTWASVVAGDVSASTAARMGLIKVARAEALIALDAFAAGPAPFCNEYF
ncbi:MAG: enhanced intracellular survival protein Eis [Phycisphaerae bacterium]|nr:GNAT family N-acetyltransferase [Tepidisphaeraceae bacterium]